MMYHPADLPHRLHSIAEIRQLEQAAKMRLPPGSLMRRAGEAVAQFAQNLLAENGRILILAGAGDNGGDALEAAAQLAHAAWDVDLYFFSSENASADTVNALQNARHSPANFISPQQFQDRLSDYQLVIDGLFGIGLNRPIDGNIAAIIYALKAHQQSRSFPILAIDVPSGLNADNGQLIGDIALAATCTISFIADKIGLHTAKGKDYAGTVIVNDLGIVDDDYPDVRNGEPVELLTEAQCRSYSLKRQHDSHKGSYGDVLIVGGCAGMQGAALLAARAALFSGAGRVHIGFMSDFTSCDLYHPELMCRLAQESDFRNACVIIGPGLGRDDSARHFIQQALSHSSKLVLDADALNLMAQDPALQAACRNRSLKNWQTIITPHPLEAARLLHCGVEEIQNNRVQAARELARTFHTVALLKGAGSIIANPEQTCLINSSGNAGLATAGTGDVLAGLSGALLAQRTAIQAASLACYLHGAAADDLVAQGVGPIGISASEFIPAIRTRLNRLNALSH